MIAVHRLTHPECPLYLNPDLIQQIETTPDTVDHCSTNGTRLVVDEEPAEILDADPPLARDRPRAARAQRCTPAAPSEAALTCRLTRPRQHA